MEKQEIIPVNQNTFINWTNEHGESVARAFGIPEEREKELDDHIDEIHKAGENYAEIISLYSAKCMTAAELAYGVFFLGMYVENQRAKHDKLQKLKDILIGGL